LLTFSPLYCNIKGIFIVEKFFSFVFDACIAYGVISKYYRKEYRKNSNKTLEKRSYMTRA
jgi:hypothetical protein